MNRRYSLTLISAAVLLGMAACSIFTIDVGSEAVRGSGNVVQEYRDVFNFTRVELDMQGTLYIEQGDSELLRVDAEDNLQQYIYSELRGDKLILRTADDVNLKPKEPIKFYLVVKDLRELSTNANGDIKGGEFKVDELAANVNSSGSLSLANLACNKLEFNIHSTGHGRIPLLIAETLTVNLSSSGNLDILGGQVQEQVISLNSSGDYHAEDLESLRVDATLNSSGSAYIRVSDRLSGTLNSSGDIYYTGNPQVDVNTTSSGKVKQVEG